MRSKMVTMLAVFLMIVISITLAQANNEDEKTFSVLSFTENIKVSGLIEAEAGFSRDFDDVDTSDIVLATMELGFDAQITEWCTGHILFLWEEEDTEPVELDEGFITLGGTDTYPVYLTVGKLYVPFGVYETNMVSDPLTLEIGETRESALQVGFEQNGFYGSVYTYNGDINKESNDEDDKIETFGANAGYIFENENISINFGIDWTSNLLDSDGLGDGFEEVQAEFINAFPDGSFELKDYVDGIGAHVIVSAGAFSLFGEYIGASDDPEYSTDDGAGTSAVLEQEDPSAFHLECGYTFEAMGKEMTLALTYQGTDNLAGVLPEKRYGTAVSIALADQLGVALEYMHDDDYDMNDGGTDEDADTLTCQLALEF